MLETTNGPRLPFAVLSSGRDSRRKGFPDSGSEWRPHPGEAAAYMTRAYILIETAVGKTGEVAERLRLLESMKTVDAVTGPFDIVAVAEAETLNAIGDLISEGMHRIPGIVKTITCLSVSKRD